MAVVDIVAYEAIPTGEYEVQVVDVCEVVGRFGAKLRWSLEVLGDDDHAGKMLAGWTSLSGNAKSKLAKWAVSCGLSVNPGDRLDTDDLIGREAVAVVVLRRSEDGIEFNKVDALKPVGHTDDVGMDEYDPFEVV